MQSFISQRRAHCGAVASTVAGRSGRRGAEPSQGHWAVSIHSLLLLICPESSGVCAHRAEFRERPAAAPRALLSGGFMELWNPLSWKRPLRSSPSINKHHQKQPGCRRSQPSWDGGPKGCCLQQTFSTKLSPPEKGGIKICYPEQHPDLCRTHSTAIYPV